MLEGIFNTTLVFMIIGTLIVLILCFATMQPMHLILNLQKKPCTILRN
jgi:hypothetical protein